MRLTLTAYETLMARQIAIALVTGRAYAPPMGPTKGRILMRAARLACVWERNGVVSHVAEVN